MTLPLLMLLATAQPEAKPARPWTDVATLSHVAVQGNAQGQTFGFGNEFTRRWDLAALVVKAGAIRVETTRISRMAYGTTLEDAVVVEERTRTTTAESYFLSARYDYRLKDKDRWYWYAGTGWERNRPAGLDNRETVSAGVGRILVDSERTKWRLDAGLGATHEDPIIEPAGFRSSYATASFTSTLKHRFGAGTDYALDLSVTENLRETDDYLGFLKQSVTVSMTRRLGLKVGLDLAYRNRPNRIAVPVKRVTDPTQSLGSTSILAKRLDTVTTTSLVITF